MYIQTAHVVSSIFECCSDWVAPYGRVVRLAIGDTACTITCREYSKLLLELLWLSESVHVSPLRHIKLVQPSRSGYLGIKEIKQMIFLTIPQYTYLRENSSSIRGSTDLELSLQSFFVLVDLSRVKIGVCVTCDLF